ncbi:ATP-binding protein, partial [Hyella patelloides]|uniref:ATP-binding protein n=1 Tax=Hyella patelloides TaxID=1982969 RepID=UPI0011A55AFC
MQDLVNLNQIAEKILNLVAHSSNPSVLLEDLALSIGTSFQVDACIVISAKENCPQNLAIGWWSEKGFPTVDSQMLHKPCCEVLCEATDSGFSIQENKFPDIFASPTSSLIAAKFQGKTNGALVLLKSQSYSWNLSEKQLLEAMSNAMAIAFSQIQLQQQVQTQAGYQHLLNRLSNAISKSSDIKVLFNLALSEMGKALKIDRAKILTVKYKDPFFVQRKNQQTIKATLTVAENWSAQESDASFPEKFSFQLTDSDCCQQALHQAPQPLVVNEGANFPDLAVELISEGVQLIPSSALLMMPLMGKTTSESQPALVLGFLVLQRDRLYTWNTEEINLINWISVQMSTALIHHQTLNQVQSIVEERTSQLQWSVDVQAKLSEKMRQQIKQLKKLNDLKDDFLNSMSHELKTPMTSMKMAIKMLRQNISDTMRERYLDILEQEWDREYNLIKDLLTLQQVESGELAFDPQELHLNQIIENLSASFTKKWHSDKGLTLETTLSNSNLQLYSDLDSLQNILNELLLNAGKYSDADTTVQLSATTCNTLKGKEIEITVSNYGAEIEPSELPYIFDKFRRGKGVTDRAVPGTGLGLTLVKHLV